MKVRDEIKNEILRDVDAAKAKLFEGLVLDEEVKTNFISSLLSGHHILLVGPPGSGKTTLALRIARLLSPRIVVKNCPIRSYPDDEGCPWCSQAREKETVVLSPEGRVVRVQGSPELVPEDLIGDIDPEAALKYGTLSVKSFVPGKALRANHGILVLDFIDRMQERAVNVLMQALEGDTVTTGHFDEPIPLDVLIIATGTEEVFQTLPTDIIDHFDVIRLGYIEDEVKEKEVIEEKAEFRETFRFEDVGDAELKEGGITRSEALDKVTEILHRTRMHPEVKRGASVRAGISFAELLDVYPVVCGRPIEAADVKEVALFALPHRIQLYDYASSRTPDEVISEIVDEILELGKKRRVALSRDDVVAIALEIAKEDRVRRPLKYGFYDILLKRIKRYPESQLAKLYQKIYKELEEEALEKEREELTEVLLAEIEEARKLRERMQQLVRELEARALDETLETLEDLGILEKSREGLVIGKRGIIILLESLFPRSVSGARVFGYGRHSTGKKSTLGEGRVVGVRKYHLGDRYKDISLKDTMREAIRNRRMEITRDDIRVQVRDIRTQLYIVLAIDLSGTMAELEKLWYAKEAAGALALSSLRYKDKVGVVSFSNLAEEVIDVTDNPYRVMKAVIELDLHENAFTNIGYGIRKAREMLLRRKKSSAARHIILISDGDATAPDPSPERFAIREAIKTVKKGITLSTVCINQASANPELMKRIAKIGKGNVIMIEEEAKLAEALLEDRDKIRAKI